MTYLGYQVCSMKTYLSNPCELLSFFRKLRDIGYRHVLLQCVEPSAPLQYIAEALQETGLTCIATQDSFRGVWTNLDYYIKMNKCWGSKTLCVGSIPREKMTMQGLAEFAAEMRRISQSLGEHGISLTFYPPASNFALIDGVSAVDTVMRLFSKDIRLTLCIMQALGSGFNPVGLLERYSGRIDICRFQNAKVFSEGRTSLVPFGQDRIDWIPVFEACHRTGVKWGLMAQENWQEDVLVCAKESYDYISSRGISSPDVF